MEAQCDTERANKKKNSNTSKYGSCRVEYGIDENTIMANKYSFFEELGLPLLEENVSKMTKNSYTWK